MAETFEPTQDQAMVSHTQGHRVLMQTALTTATNEEGNRSQTVRILFDTGSSRTYVSENVNKALGLKQEGSDRISLATFGATHRSVKEYPVVNVHIKQKNGELASIQANVINNISCPLQKVPLSTAKHSSLQKLILAEPLCNTPEAMPIDILIGADQYFQFVGSEKLEYPDGLILIDSTLGFLVAGKVKSNGNDDHTLMCHEALSLFAAEACAPKEFDLERFWNLENVGISEKEMETENDQVKGNRTKVPGMGWDTEDDVIWVPPPRAFHEIETKRQLLQCISSVFDPMGVVSPVTVEAKIIMQELWKRKFGWDDILPDDVRKECQKLCDSLLSLSGIKLPRFVGARNNDG